MKRLQQLPADKFLRLVFGFVSLCFLVAAVLMPDREKIFNGLITIVTNTAKSATNDFDLGGYAGSFFDAALVCFACTALFFLPGAKANGASVIGFLLTAGFAFWGINIMNMWFGILGVLLYCLVKRQAPGKHVNAMLFTTGLTPLFSDLLFRYPGNEVHTFTWQGLVLALAVGLVVGFFLPAGLVHSPKMHKGYSIYSAAAPLVFIAFFLYSILYKLMGAVLPDSPVNQHTASWLAADLFCLILFGLCILFALLMGCTPKDYWNLLKDSGHSVDFTQKYGNAAFLMNMGVYGLFILLYYNLIGAEWNAITFGCVFAMLASCASGAHPRNVWPIMVGYVAASFLFRWIAGPDYAYVINNQTIVIGLCFANALAPVSGKYGWWAGVISAMMHYCIVSNVPSFHGGFCLYNGGFTACMVCFVLIPILEHFGKTKEERKLAKQQQ